MDELDRVDRQCDVEALMDKRTKGELIELAKAEGATFSKRGSKTEIAREIVEARAADAADAAEVYKRTRKTHAAYIGVPEPGEVAPEPKSVPDPLAGKSLDERRGELEAARATDTAARDLAEQYTKPEPEPEPEPEAYGRVPDVNTLDGGVVVIDGDSNTVPSGALYSSLHDDTDATTTVVVKADTVNSCGVVSASADDPEIMEARVAVSDAVKAYNEASGGGRVHAPVQRDAKMVARAALASLLNARVA